MEIKEDGEGNFTIFMYFMEVFMEKEKLRWYVVNKEYVDFLQKHDKRVENIDYKVKLKPYIGIIIKINDFNYYVPISSVKEKHYKMKEDMDFIKIIQNNKILGVLNLNNMIPILDEDIAILKYKDIAQFRNFNSEKDRKLYISFLSLELKLINKKANKIRKLALKLYEERQNNPNSKISQRCCDFKLLEKVCVLHKRK